MDVELDYFFKILVIGDSGVGKSSLVHRYTDYSFNDKYQATIGFDPHLKRIVVKDCDVKLQIWDVAGQENYRTLISSIYQNAYGAIIVYDCTKEETFGSITKWLEELDVYAPNTINKILIGNKIDDVTSKELAKGLGIPFVETSAKTGENVEEAFVALAVDILNCIRLPPSPTLRSPIEMSQNSQNYSDTEMIEEAPTTADEDNFVSFEDSINQVSTSRNNRYNRSNDMINNDDEKMIAKCVPFDCTCNII